MSEQRPTLSCVITLILGRIPRWFCFATFGKRPLPFLTPVISIAIIGWGII